MSELSPAYTTAILELFRRHGEPYRIDLARPLTEADRSELYALLGGPFAVLTACNPHGEQIEEAENERRSAELRERLLAAGTRFLRADGRSPDNSYRESGVAVLLAQSAAHALAVELEQEAYYWFDGDAIWLVAALASHPPVRLPAG